MESQLRVSVLPYVYKYIWHTYGPGDRFDLTQNPRSDLRVSLGNFHLTATLIPQTKRLHGKWITFDIGGNDDLQYAAKQSKSWIRSGAFFQHEFMLALRHYIEAQKELAQTLGLNDRQWNARIGLENFIKKYRIEEYEYSYESLRRQYNRLNIQVDGLFIQKVSTKLNFRPSEYQGFKPAKNTFGKHAKIYFTAFSRSKEDFVRKDIKIPRRIIEDVNHLDQIQYVCNYINRHLRLGHSIA